MGRAGVLLGDRSGLGVAAPLITVAIRQAPQKGVTFFKLAPARPGLPPLPKTARSFAYDGKRRRKWNVAASPYGEAWSAGDVIGCCIDMDAGQISYWRNGVDQVRYMRPVR